MIPNIINQYYPDNIIPPNIKKFMDKWRNMHPNWEYVLYTPQKLKELGLNSDITIAKFEIIDKNGGFFIDYHFEPIKKLDDFLDDGDIIIIGNEHPLFFKKINQDFFGGAPNQSIWKDAIKNKKIINNNYDNFVIDENLFVSVNQCDYTTECNLLNCKYKFPDSFAIYHHLQTSILTKIFCFMKKYLIKILTILTFLIYFAWYKSIFISFKESFRNVSSIKDVFDS